MKFCIVGGGGYVGYNLGRRLKSQGHEVILYDLRYPPHLKLDGFNVVKGNILDNAQLVKAFDGCVAVFHLAAYGMTGRESLNDTLIYSVNVTGTHNVVEACVEACVPRLVYASTTDVVWCNSFIENGKESDMPYLQSSDHVDNYGRTKTEAEKYVLSMDGAKTAKGTLSACALRFHGIYGAQEIRTTQRIMQSGGRSTIQYVSGDNCIQAMLRAYERLGKEYDHIAGGEAYFIMDAKPVDAFDFWSPVFDYFHKPLPYIRLPFSMMYYLGYLMEILSWHLGFEPTLTRKEVNHAAITHWFSIEKAVKQLDYRPEPADFASIIRDYKERVEPDYLLAKTQGNYSGTGVLIPIVAALLVLIYFLWVQFF